MEALWIRRAADFARAAPGEFLLLTIVAACIVGGGIVVYTKTAAPAPPPIKHRAAAAPSSPSLTVHVAGLVKFPGVYKLKDGSRVTDAVEAAGGALEGADLHSLNLAARVSDGEKITVSAPGAASEPSAPGQSSGKVNLNTASIEELERLPGVGPVLAKRIVEYRAKKRFSSVKQLLEVEGVGPKKFASLRDLVAV